MKGFVEMPSPIHLVTLMRHPEIRSGAVRNVSAHVSREPRGTLAVTYSIDGDLARLRVPPPRPPRVAPGLWQHTCCECFIAVKGAPGYHEFNFAPSGEWCAYAFAKYREGGPLADEALQPNIAVRSATGGFQLDASIALDRLSAMHRRASLALALSAVVEDEHGGLSYWALKHAPGRPDFHHPDAFALELE